MCRVLMTLSNSSLITASDGEGLASRRNGPVGSAEGTGGSEPGRRATGEAGSFRIDDVAGLKA